MCYFFFINKIAKIGDSRSTYIFKSHIKSKLLTIYIKYDLKLLYFNNVDKPNYNDHSTVVDFNDLGCKLIFKNNNDS